MNGALGSQRRGEAVAHRGFPPGGTAVSVAVASNRASKVSRLVRVASPFGEATGVMGKAPFSNEIGVLYRNQE
ncbi:hypothetical protein [Nostoc sp.]|uniref:hypothetical protein n=1 Tax=Nostoc sp. TaxID=1180 RepID=UPI002FFAA39B